MNKVHQHLLFQICFIFLHFLFCFAIAIMICSVKTVSFSFSIIAKINSFYFNFCWRFFIMQSSSRHTSRYLDASRCFGRLFSSHFKTLNIFFHKFFTLFLPIKLWSCAVDVYFCFSLNNPWILQLLRTPLIVLSSHSVHDVKFLFFTNHSTVNFGSVQTFYSPSFFSNKFWNIFEMKLL